MSKNPITPCRLLPDATAALDARFMTPHRGRYDDTFYQAALTYAQSLWLRGKPAQAILQLNKAWSADLKGSEAVLTEWPPPYRALAWILRHSPEDAFLGNPVRHFQHLATRMSGRNAETRIWRAWACFHLSESILAPSSFPRDESQIATEKLAIPEADAIHRHLNELGWPGEAIEWRNTVGSLVITRDPTEQPPKMTTRTAIGWAHGAKSP